MIQYMHNCTLTENLTIINLTMEYWLYRWFHNQFQLMWFHSSVSDTRNQTCSAFLTDLHHLFFQIEVTHGIKAKGVMQNWPCRVALKFKWFFSLTAPDYKSNPMLDIFCMKNAQLTHWDFQELFSPLLQLSLFLSAQLWPPLLLALSESQCSFLDLHVWFSMTSTPVPA